MVHYVESIKNFGTTDNYNMEMFEHFHIHMAKDGWKASNFRNEVPQMTRWLTQQEKVSIFQCYVQDVIRDATHLISTPTLSGTQPMISQ